METVFSCCYTALIALILGLLLKKLVPEISVSIVMLAMIMCFMSAIAYIGVIKDEILRFTSASELSEDYIHILLQVCSVGVLSKICSELCLQAGESALSSAIDFLGGTAALFCSLPLWSGVGNLLLSFLNS